MIAMGDRHGGVALGDRSGEIAMDYRRSLVYGRRLSLVERPPFVSRASLGTLTILSVQSKLICLPRFFY